MRQVNDGSVKLNVSRAKSNYVTKVPYLAKKCWRHHILNIFTKKYIPYIIKKMVKERGTVNVWQPDSEI